jgi:hypothetical protein
MLRQRKRNIFEIVLSRTGNAELVFGESGGGVFQGGYLIGFTLFVVLFTLLVP